MARLACDLWVPKPLKISRAIRGQISGQVLGARGACSSPFPCSREGDSRNPGTSHCIHGVARVTTECLNRTCRCMFCSGSDRQDRHSDRRFARQWSNGLLLLALNRLRKKEQVGEVSVSNQSHIKSRINPGSERKWGIGQQDERSGLCERDHSPWTIRPISARPLAFSLRAAMLGWLAHIRTKRGEAIRNANACCWQAERKKKKEKKKKKNTHPQHRRVWLRCCPAESIAGLGNDDSGPV
mgnify:CR=1 FL=1